SNTFAGNAVSYLGGIENIYFSSNGFDYLPVTGDTNWYTNLDLAYYENSSNIFYFVVSNSYSKLTTNRYTNYFDFTPPELSFATNYNNTTQSNIYQVGFTLSNDFAPLAEGSLSVYNSNNSLVTNIPYNLTSISNYGSHTINLDTYSPLFPAGYYDLVLSVTNQCGLGNIISNTNILFTNELTGILTEYDIISMPAAVTAGSNFNLNLRLFNDSGLFYPATTNLDIAISGPLPSLENIPTMPVYSADGTNFVNTGDILNVDFNGGNAQITMKLYRATNTVLLNGTGGDLPLAASHFVDVYPAKPFIMDTVISASPSNNAVTGNNIYLRLPVVDEYHNLVTNNDLDVALTVSGPNAASFSASYNTLSNSYTADYLAAESGRDQITATVEGVTVVNDTDSFSNDGIYEIDINKYTASNVSNTMNETGEDLILVDNPVSGVSGQATVIFNAASGSTVAIEVFDLLSRVVWKKTDIALQNNGVQEVLKWNLRYNYGSKKGEKIPPGIYFIRKTEDSANKQKISTVKLIVQ
ncbi:MAG TPA: hypothetical protein VKS21_05465, partial [Spirochaetota bacterium]|nr:hypothetical protein [Spirochaetota bacterium]